MTGRPKLPPKKGSASRGIQSVAAGYSVLKVMAASSEPMYLREIAKAVDMSTTKVFRHLASFVDIGLVKQVEGSGRYDLGPAAIQLGLASLRRLDSMSVAVDALRQISEELEIDAHVTVWGDAGPTVVRWLGRPGEVAIRVSEGRILPVVASSTGRLWCVHLPSATTKRLITRELASLSRKSGEPVKNLRADFDHKLALIKEHGLAYSMQERRIGFDALCGPVFDRDGLIAFAITAIGIHGERDYKPGGDIADRLAAALAEASMRLGFNPQ